MIHLFTDGSARGNPGPGGYGAILRYGPHEKELTQGYRRTTNNRMELLAVIVGLEAVTRPEIPVLVVSDSKYVVDAVEKRWVFGWEKKPDFGQESQRRFVATLLASVPAAASEIPLDKRPRRPRRKRAVRCAGGAKRAGRGAVGG